MTFRAKPCRDEVVADAMKFETLRFVSAGLLSLYLLKQTINDYRAGGIDDVWTLASAIGFLVVAQYFVSMFRGLRG